MSKGPRRQSQILIVAYRPVEGGWPSDNKRDTKILKLSKKYNVAPAQLAIRWLIQQEGVITIPKASNKQHIDANLKALDFELAEEDMAVLSL